MNIAKKRITFLAVGSRGDLNPLEVIKTTKQRVILSPNWSEIEKKFCDRDNNIFVNSSYIPFN